MKNRHIEAFKSKIKIYLRGKNVNRYLLRLAKNHVSLLHLERISKEEVYVTIYYKDYALVSKLNTIYEIGIIEYGGLIKEKKKTIQNKWIILAVCVAIGILFLLSRMIFTIEIVTNDEQFKQQLLIELKQYHIEKYAFQKSYQELSKIKESILANHRNDLEWLEIETIGTKYRVRYEPRIESPKKEESGYRHVIAKKNAIIKKIESSFGQNVKFLNDYVKKGDIIVSGYISLNGTIQETVSANAKVYGEVWYEVEVFYPFGYYEQTKTGRQKNVYVLEFLSHRIEFFHFHPFYDKMVTRHILLQKRGIPIALVKETQEEVHTISVIETEEGAIFKAKQFATNKIESQLKESEYIIHSQVMKKVVEKDGVRLRVFFSVYEDITDYEAITPYVEDQNEGDHT